MTAADIRAAREALGLTQADFAALCGVTGTGAKVTVARWESGKRKPSGAVLLLINQALHQRATQPR